MHFCMGEVVGIALFSKASTCNLAAKTPDCKKGKHSSCHVGHKSCCEDHTFLIEAQDELAKSTSVSIPSHQMMTLLYRVASFLSLSSTVETHAFIEYSPPPLDRDITILHRTFLI